MAARYDSKGAEIFLIVSPDASRTCESIVRILPRGDGRSQEDTKNKRPRAYFGAPGGAAEDGFRRSQVAFHSSGPACNPYIELSQTRRFLSAAYSHHLETLLRGVQVCSVREKRDLICAGCHALSSPLRVIPYRAVINMMPFKRLACSTKNAGTDMIASRRIGAGTPTHWDCTRAPRRYFGAVCRL